LYITVWTWSYLDHENRILKGPFLHQALQDTFRLLKTNPQLGDPIGGERYTWDVAVAAGLLRVRLYYWLEEPTAPDEAGVLHFYAIKELP
jgi:hypothetical protein